MRKVVLVLSVLVGLIACNEQSQKESSVKDTSEYLEKGQEIAGTTFGALSKELKSSLTNHGVDSAVKYCNVNAFSISDSLSEELGAMIKRTSLKVRNPKNAPTTIEKEWLEKYSNKTQTDAIVVEESGKYHYFSPIYTGPVCLKCHGEVGKEIDQNDYQTIQTLYPDDQATDFSSGDLRGMWSITFKK